MFQAKEKRPWNIPSCPQDQSIECRMAIEFVSLPSPKLKFVVEADVIVRNAWRLHIVFSGGNFCTLVFAEPKITDLTEL
jgi:hypothetical protein